MSNIHREHLLADFKARLDEIWNGEFKALTREPIVLGSVTHWAQPFLEKSVLMAEKRFLRLAENKRPYWEDDAGFKRFTENAISDSDENKNWRIEHVNPPEFWG